ncbi:MAG: C25 family cysteine peptidase [Bacteroidota bacterium]
MKNRQAAKCIFAFILVLLIPMLVLGQISHSVFFNVSEFSFAKRDGFDIVRGKGLPMSTEVGAPMLPIKNISLIIPPAMDVSSVTIEKKNPHVISGKFRIYPAQPPIVTSLNVQGAKFISPNPIVYSSNSPYPATPVKVMNTEYFDGSTRIVHLEVCPFEYKPATGALTMFTEISFTLNFKPSTHKPIHVKRRAKIAQDAYDQALHALVDNPGAIPAYQQRPDSVYVDNVSIGASSTVVQPNIPPSPPPYPLPGPLTIITSSGLASSFTSFINQKAADGIRAKVVTTDQIYYYFPNGDQVSSPAINDPAGCIRQYLHDEAYPDGCTWVLLAGDQGLVPTRYVSDAYAQYPGEQVPTDLYFSDLTGNWNPNNFSPSLSPTVFVGRIPFTTPQDVATWANKVIQYETNAFPGNQSAVTKVLWSVSDEMEDDGETQSVSATFPSNFTQTFIEELPSGGDANPTFPTGAQIISTLNSGYGFYSMDHHGSPDHVAVRTSGYNGYPKYGIFSYDSYTSGQYFGETGNGFDNTTNNCTILYSIACDVAEYDSAGDDCMAKAWLRVSGGGPAFLGNTREGLVSYSSGLERAFLQQIFNSGNTRLGQAEGVSKSTYGNLFLAESNNLFGDPSMIMWTSTPSGSVAEKQGLSKGELESTSENIPKEFALSQNYPNPFNPSTTIHFALPVDSHVTLKVYDMLGREVMTLVDGYQNAGYHEVKFDGTRFSSGIYIYRLTADNFVSVKKMLMLK